TVHDVVCTAGPFDRPFEERRDWVCIAVVKQGTFQYRTSHGRATLAPGAILLGNAGQCFECSHEHGSGDHCLSLHFAPDYFERIIAAIPGERLPFEVPRLPPSPSLIPFIVAAESAEHDAMEMEEIACKWAGGVVRRRSGPPPAATARSKHDERRVSEAARRIEADPSEPMTLVTLARQAGTSPFHFLRVFRSVTGVTPHQ